MSAEAEKELRELRRGLEAFAQKIGSTEIQREIFELLHPKAKRARGFRESLRALCRSQGYVLWIDEHKGPQIREWVQGDDDYMAKAVFEED